MTQLTLFDEPSAVKPGDWVTTHGAVIPKVMRPSYIGKLVVIDLSTQSHKWFKVARLERIVENDGHDRSVLYTGTKQRSIITHYPGREIFELEPWNFEERRNKDGKTKKTM